MGLLIDEFDSQAPESSLKTLSQRLMKNISQTSMHCLLVLRAIAIVHIPQVNLRAPRVPPIQQNNYRFVSKIISIDVYEISFTSLWESVFKAHTIYFNVTIDINHRSQLESMLDGMCTKTSSQTMISGIEINR